MEIEFFAHAATVKTLLPPIPAAKAIPEWWIKAEREVKGSGEAIWAQGDNLTFKGCQPFTDVLRTGYIIPLWQDIRYADTREHPDHELRVSVNWGRGQNVASGDEGGIAVEAKGWDSWREIEGVENNLIEGTSFSFVNPWVIRTPPGYSCLFTAPLNSEDNRIRLFSGIVNTDTYFNSVNFFFGFRKDIELPGVLKRGMPLVQVIPFKREEWVCSVKPIDRYSEEYNLKHSVINELTSHLKGGYKAHHGCPIKHK